MGAPVPLMRSGFPHLLSNRACGFPAHGFPLMVDGAACTASGNESFHAVGAVPRLRIPRASIEFAVHVSGDADTGATGVGSAAARRICRAGGISELHCRSENNFPIRGEAD